MARKDMTVTIPPICETQLTGFIGASERVLYGATWRVEWWNDQPARLLKDGQPQEVKQIGLRDTRAVRSLLTQSHAFFTRANELAGGRA